MELYQFMKKKIKNPLDLSRQLKDNNIPFDCMTSVFTVKIFTEDTEYYFTANTGLKQNELGLIKQVKDYIINNNITAKSNRKYIKYTDKSNIKNGTYKNDLYEVDLKSAYWVDAFRKGFISKEIFERGNDTKKISKGGRLIALGNTAKRSIKLSFNGVEFVGKPEIIQSGIEDIFFNVSGSIDVIMQHLKFIAGENYLFYWVDAVFIRGEGALNLITEFLNDQNIEFKVLKLNKILKTSNYIKVWDDKNLWTTEDFKNLKCTKLDIGSPKPRPFLFKSFKIKDLSSIFV